DYFGRWKALQFYARRFYADLLVSPHEQDGKIAVYVVSDKVKETPAQLHVVLMDFDGKVLMEKSSDVTLAPIASKIYLQLDKAELLAGHNPSRVFFNCELRVDGKRVSDNRLFFKPYKELDLPAAKIASRVRPVAGGYEISLKSDGLARAVYLSVENVGRSVDGQFSDNFFDLLPGKPVTVIFKAGSETRLDAIRDGLRVSSLADSY
ncbi:MAG: glycoside hydrolase family 2 protein, partial [Blastocatellia bacterium]